MNIQNMTKYAVGLLVGLVMVAGLIIPIVEDSIEPNHTYTNEGTTFATPDGGAHVIAVSSNGDSIKATFDGVAMALPETWGIYSVIVGESGFIRLNPTTGQAALALNNTVTNATVPYTITIQGNSATLNNKTIPDVVAYQAPEGELCLCDSPVVAADSPIYGAGNSYFTSSCVPESLNYWQTFNGTVEAIAPNWVATIPPSTTTEYNDVTVNASNFKSDLKKIDSIVFDITADAASADPVDVELTYTYFLVPSTIEYANPGYAEFGAPLLSIIPLMAIIVLVVYAANFVRNRA